MMRAAHTKAPAMACAAIVSRNILGTGIGGSPVMDGGVESPPRTWVVSLEILFTKVVVVAVTIALRFVVMLPALGSVSWLLRAMAWGGHYPWQLCKQIKTLLEITNSILKKLIYSFILYKIIIKWNEKSRRHNDYDI